jgi:threonine/homoserine/homoserine lactone efflux protein
MISFFHAHGTEFLQLYAINFINLVSPGAGFALMVRNSALYGRKTGFYTAFGITSSSLIHKSYTLLGFGLIVSQTPWLYMGIKYLGSFYLTYLGLRNILHAVQHKKQKIVKQDDIKNDDGKDRLTPWQGFRNGFLVDMMNPSASLSFVCIVVSTVHTSTGLSIRGIYVLILILTSLIWYSFLAFTFSHSYLMRFNERFGRCIEFFMGGFLVYLGTKLLMAPVPESCRVLQESIKAIL